MALTRILLPISILWFCFYSSHTILQKDPLLICVNGDPGFDQRAYPSYFGHILDEFSSIMGFEPSILSLEGFNPVGSPETSSDTELSVDDFGARGDGTDDTKAFEKAWKEACSSGSVFIVPENKNYLLKQITFSGPCKSDLQVKIRGTIIASSDQSDWVGHNRKRWIEFEDINDLTVEGGGTINGNGETWWDSSCKRKKSLPCKSAPTALTFRSCKNLFVSDLSIKDSQKMHLSFDKCQDVIASNLMVSAPEHSPNTDGIHITGTQRIHVMNSVIGTGDDCISIESGSKMVTATNITCGPGHGISIGSLGDRNSEARVSGVLVDGGNLFDTTNGLRIKTWQGGSGSAKNIKFQNIVMHNVTNPIIIDQYYCDSKDPCPEQESAVKISNVAYMNISGTSASEVAVKFDCSKSSPCQGILLKNINLVGNGGKETTMSCSNIVQGTTEGKVYPPSCL
ncbi:Polygalacturonase [Cinnamomum micranthum f. kanehirae]|uniref:endo-polygalacturonase n=1 Tax=Cinnamomum micranthum f. kanehirae TaxID=337451 RepID=A0A3S3M3M9_9MAGN|nr:Polygalacturonase [Cinnamomum micranthum f. kanehirae]